MITDAAGRLLYGGQTRPGSIHDLTQVRQAGLVELLALVPGATLLADARLPGPERADRRRGRHPATSAAEGPDSGLPGRRRGARGRTPGSRGRANPRRARHQPPGELASPVPPPRPTRTPRHDPACGRRAGLQPGTSPTTRAASPPAKSSPGRYHQVIAPPNQSNDGPPLTMHEFVSSPRVIQEGSSFPHLLHCRDVDTAREKRHRIVLLVATLLVIAAVAAMPTGGRLPYDAALKGVTQLCPREGESLA